MHGGWSLQIICSTHPPGGHVFNVQLCGDAKISKSYENEVHKNKRIKLWVIYRFLLRICNPILEDKVGHRGDKIEDAFEGRV